MITINPCSECEGKGSYKVFNAYDPEYSETVVCEYCDGTGLATLPPEREAKVKPPRDWVN